MTTPKTMTTPKIMTTPENMTMDEWLWANDQQAMLEANWEALKDKKPKEQEQEEKE